MGKKVGKGINKDMKKLGKDVKKFGKAASKKTQKVVKKVLKHVKKTEKKVTDFFTKLTKPWFKRFKWTDQALETTEVQESANNGQQEGFDLFKAARKAWNSVRRSVKKEEKKITKIAIPAVTGVMGLHHTGEDCWSGCNRKQGRCSWCGPTGF